MVTTVYLFRHGRTALNAAGMLRGRIDAPLDHVGKSEASRLGDLFAPVRLTRVISSPLGRSLETARAVARPHGLDVIVDDAFLDRDYGPWAGKSEQDVAARYGSVDDAPPDEIEPRERFERRVVAALERVAAQADGEFIAVVAHDAVNRALIRAFGETKGAGPSIPQPTGCWNRIVFEGGAAACDVVGALPGDGTAPR